MSGNLLKAERMLAGKSWGLWLTRATEVIWNIKYWKKNICRTQEYSTNIKTKWKEQSTVNKIITEKKGSLPPLRNQDFKKSS